ncbi:MAG: hypothetical protein V4534_07120 [Myxococcota bacterium]
MTQKRQILLQNALALLCEAQRRAATLKDETSEEIKDLMHKVSHQAKEGAVTLVHYWHDNKEHLPSKMTSEVDRLLHKMGLVKATKAPAKKAAPKKAAAPKKKAPAAAKAPVKKAAPAAKKAPAKKAPARKASPSKTTPPAEISA